MFWGESLRVDDWLEVSQYVPFPVGAEVLSFRDDMTTPLRADEPVWFVVRGVGLWPSCLKIPSATLPRLQPIPLINRSGGTTLDIKDIRTIIELMKRNDLTHFELEREGEKLVLKKNIDSESLAGLLAGYRGPAPAAPAVSSAPAGGISDQDVAAPAAAVAPDVLTIKSPMVGTFYRASGPGSDVFVKVGDYVEAETTVCIIEAMKVMNEIKAEVAGRITRIVVEDASPVSYGQILFEVKP